MSLCACSLSGSVSTPFTSYVWISDTASVSWRRLLFGCTVDSFQWPIPMWDLVKLVGMRCHGVWFIAMEEFQRRRQLIVSGAVHKHAVLYRRSSVVMYTLSVWSSSLTLDVLLYASFVLFTQRLHCLICWVQVALRRDGVALRSQYRSLLLQY
jgi:hypothetical protein